MKKTFMMVAAFAALSMTVAMTSCKKEDKNGATDSTSGSSSGTCTCTYTDFQTGERYTEKINMAEVGVTKCSALEFYIQGDSQLVCN